MSTSLFPVAFLRPPAADYFETTTWLSVNERSEGAYSAVLNTAQDPLFACRGTVRFPYGNERARKTYDDLQDFIDARSGSVDTFLYLPVLARNRTVVGGALGTGTGTETVFAFSDGTNLHRHIVSADHSDPETLLVYVAGTLNTNWTLSGNDSDPTVTFGAGVNGAVTVSYQFYVPVRMVSMGEPRVLSRRPNDAVDYEEIVDVDMALEEDRAGRRFAS